MVDSSFFNESTEQSLIKAEIVSKYFMAWAKVILPSVSKRGGKLAYIDLFAGPGRYKDGSTSTPLLILTRAIQEPDLRLRLVTIFNDQDDQATQTLEKEIASLVGIDTLTHYPQIGSAQVGTEIVELFESMQLVPTLFFVDPWGYKGLSLRLISSVLKDWGSDCIFFFNYNRINMGLTNPKVVEHMNALFGEERAEELRKELRGMTPEERELTVVEALTQSLKEMGGRYVLPFTFKRASGERTSHYLFFVSKHVRGYEIMKDVMARQSSSHEQGVPSFAYSPASQRQPLLFALSRPLDELENMLLETFAGKTLRMKEIYERHHIDRPYIEKNYKHALASLESKGLIEAIPPSTARPNRQGRPTFGDKVQVIFPQKGEVR